MCQAQPAAEKKKLPGVLKESMLQGSPFPRLHTKAAETKAMIKPVLEVLKHYADLDPTKRALVNAMLGVLECSHSIDELVDAVQGYKMAPRAAQKLEELVMQMNEGSIRLCHAFHQEGVFLFNFVPKNHYLIHLAQLGRHMSPKLAWCYQGEDLMNRIKVLAQGSFRGTPYASLGNKVLAKYLIGVAHALSDS